MTEVQEKKRGFRAPSLPIQLLLAMLLGAGTGLLLGQSASAIGFIGQIFMRLLKMCVYPLVLISIISGVASVVDIARLRRVGLTFLAYTAISSGTASIFAIIAVTLSGAGRGVDLGEEVSDDVQSANFLEWITEWVPDNVFASMSNGNLIQIIIFAVFFGVFLSQIRGTTFGDRLFEVVMGLDEIFKKMVGVVIKVAPIGVFALIANMIGTTDLAVVRGMLRLLMSYYGAMIAFMLTFIPLVLIFVAKVNPLKFYQNVSPQMLMAASTCSSSGTLPVTMKVAKERAGVPEDIVNLIAAPAATINMNGAAIEYPCFILFAAHAFGVDLSLGQILFTIVLCVMMSAGAAGVPGGGIMMCAICLTTMGLPDATMTAIVAGMYVLFDFCSTMLSVTSDSVGMVTIASREKTLNREIFNAVKKAA